MAFKYCSEARREGTLYTTVVISRCNRERRDTASCLYLPRVEGKVKETFCGVNGDRLITQEAVTGRFELRTMQRGHSLIVVGHMTRISSRIRLASRLAMTGWPRRKAFAYFRTVNPLSFAGDRFKMVTAALQQIQPQIIGLLQGSNLTSGG